MCLLLGGGGEGDVLPFIANMPGLSDRVHRCRVHSKRTVKGRDARKVTSKQGWYFPVLVVVNCFPVMKHVQQVCWLCDTSWGRVHSNSEGIMNNRVARNVMLKKGWYFAVEKTLSWEIQVVFMEEGNL